MTSGFDVVVLAGGRSTRYGSDKLAVLLDQVLSGLPAEAGVVCVGMERATVRPGVRWAREEPPFSGPLNAVAAGMAQVPARIVVLVGGDMPRVGLAVPSLARLAATTDRAAALVDATGTVQPLASAWPRDVLVAALDTLRPLENRPVRHLLAAVLEPVGQVLDEWGAANDVDFPTDLG